MTGDLDAWLADLAAAPTDRSLAGLEAEVGREIAGRRRDARTLRALRPAGRPEHRACDGRDGRRRRRPLLLTAFEGLSQQEAGEILGVSAKAVETRIYRARRLLAERLGADLGPSAET